MRLTSKTSYGAHTTQRAYPDDPRVRRVPPRGDGDDTTDVVAPFLAGRAGDLDGDFFPARALADAPRRGLTRARVPAPPPPPPPPSASAVVVVIVPSGEASSSSSSSSTTTTAAPAALGPPADARPAGSSSMKT